MYWVAPWHQSWYGFYTDLMRESEGEGLEALNNCPESKYWLHEDPSHGIIFTFIINVSPCSAALRTRTS